MTRLIDADALIDELGISDEDIVFEEILEDAPTIDAVPVVRCGDCKYGEYREDFDDYECNHSGCGLVFNADDFCSNGERKDND